MSSTEIHIGAATHAPKEDQKKTTDLDSIAVRKKKDGLMNQINDFLASFTPIKASDKVSFFRLLATMINAGISIVKSLRILEDQTENLHFKKIIANIGHQIETGNSFSEALKTHNKYFSDAQVGMVEAGEAAGRLNQTLLQIATETEKSAALAGKIKGAMLYPMVVIFILFAAFFGVMTFVIPKIKDMFDSLGGELPGMTKVLITASDFMTGKTIFGLPNAVLIIVVSIGAIFAFLTWKKTKMGRYLFDMAFLYFPVFGKLSRKVALARFCRGLSTLTSSGISIIKALRITADSVDNAVYQKRIHQIADDVKQGITMGENMQDDEKLFPSMIVGMISVAEQTAQIDSISDKLASFFEEDVDDMVKNLSSLLEPLIIVVLGGSVGFLVIAIMLPILQSTDMVTG